MGSLKVPWRQAWTEWLSNAKAVLTMEPWFGTTRAGGAATLEEIINALRQDSGKKLEDLEEVLKKASFEKQPRAGKDDETKTSSPCTDNKLGAVRVASGFEELYRRFTATPGNTLSLQARLGAVLEGSLISEP